MCNALIYCWWWLCEVLGYGRFVRQVLQHELLEVVLFIFFLSVGEMIRLGLYVSSRSTVNVRFRLH